MNPSPEQAPDRRIRARGAQAALAAALLVASVASGCVVPTDEPFEVPLGFRLYALYLLSTARPVQPCTTQNTNTAGTVDKTISFGPTSEAFAGATAQTKGRAYIVVTVTSGQQVVFASTSGALSAISTPFPLRGNFCVAQTTLVTFNMTSIETTSFVRRRQINETGTFTFDATTTADPLPTDLTVRIE